MNTNEMKSTFDKIFNDTFSIHEVALPSNKMVFKAIDDPLWK